MRPCGLAARRRGGRHLRRPLPPSKHWRPSRGSGQPCRRCGAKTDTAETGQEAAIYDAVLSRIQTAAYLPTACSWTCSPAVQPGRQAFPSPRSHIWLTSPSSAEAIPENIRCSPAGCLDPLSSIWSSRGVALPVRPLPLIDSWLNSETRQSSSSLAHRAAYKPLLRKSNLLLLLSRHLRLATGLNPAGIVYHIIITFAVVEPQTRR